VGELAPAGSIVGVPEPSAGTVRGRFGWIPAGTRPPSDEATDDRRLRTFPSASSRDDEENEWRLDREISLIQNPLRAGRRDAETGDR